MSEWKEKDRREEGEGEMGVGKEGTHTHTHTHTKLPFIAWSLSNSDLRSFLQISRTA